MKINQITLNHELIMKTILQHPIQTHRSSNSTRVHRDRHAADEVGFIPVFAAFVADAAVQLSDEHDACDWLSLPAARGRLAWPRERRALDDIQILLGRGDAGPLEDVLRVC